MTAIATSVLVIGGGLAGAAVASQLAATGHRVTLVEREPHAVDKVCGEFISIEATLYLRDLGIDLERLGAVPIERICLVSGETTASAHLPFSAFSLSRRRLDEALLARAGSAGAKIIRGLNVVSLEQADGFWLATTGDGRQISAKDVFLATGKHDLRGWKRAPGRQNDFIAFKLHLQLARHSTEALRFGVELFLFPGGYAGLELVENDIANLCLVVRKQNFSDVGRDWETFLGSLLKACPRLRERLADARPCWPRPLAISAIPYGFVQSATGSLWRLGDQAACIPSFSGDGISIALHSARLAAQYFLDGCNAEAFQDRLARDVARHINRALLFSQILSNPTSGKVTVAVAKRVPIVLSIAARMTRIPKHRMKAVRSLGFKRPRAVSPQSWRGHGARY